MLSADFAELHRAGDLCLAWDPLLLLEAAQYVQRAPHDVGSFGSELQSRCYRAAIKASPRISAHCCFTATERSLSHLVRDLTTLCHQQCSLQVHCGMPKSAFRM